MELNEAILILKENNYIVTESLVSNGPKLLAMINDYLKKSGNYEEPFRVAEYILHKSTIKGSESFRVYRSGEKLAYNDDFLKALKHACDVCGFYCNFDAPRVINITPKQMTKQKKRDPGKCFYHVSKAANLDKTGIRIKSRLEDDMFDIYEGRIYMAMIKPSGVKSLITMITKEHRMRMSELSLYKVDVPANYEIYQDPTLGSAVYVTNSIPAKYVTKLNVLDFMTPRYYKMHDKPLDFKKDKGFHFELSRIFSDYGIRYDFYEDLIEKEADKIQKMYMNDDTPHTIVKKLLGLK